MRLEQPSSRSSSSNGVLYLVEVAGVSQGSGNLVQSEVGMNWFEDGAFIPGGGLGWVPVGLVSSGPALQAMLASVSVAGVFGGAPGGSPAGAAGGAAHFLLSVRTCHQASISFSSSFGRLGAGWRQKSRLLLYGELGPDVQPWGASHHIPPGHHCLSAGPAIKPHHNVLYQAPCLPAQAPVEDISLCVGGLIRPELKENAQMTP